MSCMAAADTGVDIKLIAPAQGVLSPAGAASLQLKGIPPRGGKNLFEVINGHCAFSKHPVQ